MASSTAPLINFRLTFIRFNECSAAAKQLKRAIDPPSQKLESQVLLIILSATAVQFITVLVICTIKSDTIARDFFDLDHILI